MSLFCHRTMSSAFSEVSFPFSTVTPAMWPCWAMPFSHSRCRLKWQANMRDFPSPFITDWVVGEEERVVDLMENNGFESWKFLASGNTIDVWPRDERGKKTRKNVPEILRRNVLGAAPTDSNVFGKQREEYNSGEWRYFLQFFSCALFSKTQTSSVVYKALSIICLRNWLSFSKALNCNFF